MNWKNDEMHRLILDIGSHKIRAGLSSFEFPQYQIENLTGNN